MSPQTVSNYLNGRHKPRRGTPERVDQAILDVGYRPNAAARALHSRRVNGVALVMEDPDDRGLHEPLQIEFLHGVAAAAHRGGHHLSVALTAPGETVEQARRILREGRAAPVEAVDWWCESFTVEAARDRVRLELGPR